MLSRDCPPGLPPSSLCIFPTPPPLTAPNTDAEPEPPTPRPRQLAVDESPAFRRRRARICELERQQAIEDLIDIRPTKSQLLTLSSTFTAVRFEAADLDGQARLWSEQHLMPLRKQFEQCRPQQPPPAPSILYHSETRQLKPALPTRRAPLPLPLMARSASQCGVRIRPVAGTHKQSPSRVLSAEDDDDEEEDDGTSVLTPMRRTSTVVPLPPSMSRTSTVVPSTTPTPVATARPDHVDDPRGPEQGQIQVLAESKTWEQEYPPSIPPRSPARRLPLPLPLLAGTEDAEAEIETENLVAVPMARSRPTPAPFASAPHVQPAPLASVDVGIQSAPVLATALPVSVPPVFPISTPMPGSPSLGRRHGRPRRRASLECLALVASDKMRKVSPSAIVVVEMW